MRKFFKTVAIVSIFSISEKFLGFLYRIYLSRTIGAEGIGLYQVALSVFGLLYTFCCSGVPVTVSRLMAKYNAQNQKERVQKVITAGLCFTLLITIPVCALFYIFGGRLSFLFADARSINIFLVILPGLVFTCVYSVLRGVFWGNKDFLPYSIIELLEEICMIVVGIILINFSQNVYQGAFRAGVAVLVSYILSFSLAVAVFFIRKNKLKNPLSEFKPLIYSATPVTAMRTASSLTSSLISIILPFRLVSAGFTEAGAIKAFGSAMGQAMPILTIPTTLIGSFTLVLIPEISENFYNNRHYYLKRDVEKAIKLTSVLTLVFIPVFFVCGEELGVLLFGEYECGKYVTATSFLMIFMSLSSISTSMLNSMGLETKTMLYYLLGGALMLLCIWFLPPLCGIYSLIIGFCFIYGLTTILNLILLNKNCKLKPTYKVFLLKACLTIIPSIFFGLMIEKILLSSLGTLLTLITCAITIVAFNLLMFFGFGLITFKEVIEKIKRVFVKKKTA